MEPLMPPTRTPDAPQRSLGTPVRISPEYLSLNRQLHADRVDYGHGGHRHLDSVRGIAQVYDCRSILDYGCGKQTLVEALRLKWARAYDPCIPGLDLDPEPADFVVCTDVLEHVEPECIDAVLDHIKSLTKRVVFFSISLTPAKKSLPDGRNTHLLVQTTRWWLDKLLSRWTLDTARNSDSELAIMMRVAGEPAREPSLTNNVRK